MVTGGTGFVGSHAVMALHRAGHDVRLLVRRPQQVPVTFGPHGWAPDDVVLGDVRDRSAVARALHGVDAVVHAAAVFSFDPRRADEMARTNEAATETVLTAAVDRGLAPVVHVSSVVVLIGGRGVDPTWRWATSTCPTPPPSAAPSSWLEGCRKAGRLWCASTPAPASGPTTPTWASR